MRGGSFNNNDRNVRCACRNNNINPNDNVGLRVVSHGFSPFGAAALSGPEHRAGYGLPGAAQEPAQPIPVRAVASPPDTYKRGLSLVRVRAAPGLGQPR